MNSSLALFYIYIFIILCFLVPLSFLISIELFNIIYYIIFNYILNLRVKQNIKYLNFFKFYIQQKQWFLCISMLEYIYEIDPSNNFLICNNLAYCYKNLSIWQISEYFYLKALLYYPSNILVLNNLLDVYNLSNQIDKAKKIKQRIFFINN